MEKLCKFQFVENRKFEVGGDIMYFYEVIEKCDRQSLINEFLMLCEDSPDIKLTEKKFRKTIESISEIEANTSDTQIIIIEKVQTNIEIYDRVYLFDMSEKMNYGLELKPWPNTLGCLVDESSLSFYGYEKYAALVLWEMTWFGFDEETIQERMKTWDED